MRPRCSSNSETKFFEEDKNENGMLNKIMRRKIKDPTMIPR
jgi:hypothetical protein